MSRYVKPGSLYIAHNGRLLCFMEHCAGSSVRATGRDLSGHKVTRINAEDVVAWKRWSPELPLQCECGAVCLYTPTTADAKP